MSTLVSKAYIAAMAALVVGSSQLTNSVSAQTYNSSTQMAGTQLAMVTPTCDPTNLRIVAQKNYQCSQFRVAQQLYKQVCQMPGVTGDDFYWLGESYMHASMFAEASAAFQQGLKLTPASDALNLGLVQSLLAARQMMQAHDACLKAAGSVTAPQTRKQLEVLLKIASMPLPPAMRGDAHSSIQVER